MQYFDKDGREIKAGMKLLMEDSSIEMVYDTVDSYGKDFYAVHAPACCSDGQQAENMLEMLGANIMDEDIYHTPDEHLKLEM